MKKINLGQHARKLIKIVLFLMILGIVMFLVMNVCLDKQSQERMGYFYDKQDDYDVMYFGASHMMFGIYPMQMWEDYGITGYNCAGYDASIPITYWMFRDMIREHKPKVAVLDVLAADRDEKYWDVEVTHITSDAIPLSKEKIRAVDDLFTDQDLRREFVFPFYLYHSRWKELTLEDFKRVIRPVHNIDMGAIFDNRIDPPKYENDADVSITEGLGGKETTGMNYIRRFIHDCRAEGIQPVLVFLPYLGLRIICWGPMKFTVWPRKKGFPISTWSTQRIWWIRNRILPRRPST